MPRLTRRSQAVQEEPSTPEPKAAKGKRGTKREKEESPSDEPQEKPPTKRGRAAANETPTKGKAAKGKAKAQEPEEDASQEEEVKPKGGRGGRSTSRKGKAAEEEEESSQEAKPARGRQAKAVPASPAKGGKGRGGRGARGKSAAIEEEEESESVSQEEESVDASQEEEMPEPVATPKRQKKAPAKKTPEPTPPSSGGRRARGKGGETPTKPSPVEEDKVVEEAEEEPTPAPSEGAGKKRKLDTEEDDGEAKRQRVDDKEDKEADGDTKEELKDFVVVEKADVPCPDSAEVAASVAKAVPSSKEEGFVTVEKADVPAPDSEEVAASIAKATPAAPAEDSTDTSDDGSAQKETNAEEVMPAPVDIPAVIPLTEAEIIKSHKKKDTGLLATEEAMSTAAECGSEAASDITNVSVPNLDFSESASMDSTLLDAKELSSAESTDDKSEKADSASVVDESEKADSGNVDDKSEKTDSISVDTSEKTDAVSGDTSEKTDSVSVDTSEKTDSVSGDTSEKTDSSSVDAPKDTTEVSATPATSNGSTPAENGSLVDNSPLKTNGVKNGSATSNEAVSNPSPIISSQPAPSPQLNGTDKPSAPAAPYVPSSTSITKRKFITNPAFPLDRMDPAACFSLVSYNILADCHMRRGDYSFTEPQYLDQAYRHSLLLKELDYLDGDVVCMQEVNPAYYKHTLLPDMASRGYEGSYIRRTSEYCDEGEATFVRSSKFTVVETQGLSLKDLAYKEIASASLSEDVASACQRYCDRADVVLLSQLECKRSKKVITVANLHVVWDPKAPDVQCVQIACVINRLVACSIKELVTKCGSDLLPHLICGDFNSTPTSPGYQLAKDGYLSDAHIRELQALEAMDNTDGSSKSIVNHIWKSFQHTSSNLKSAYETTVGSEPPVTSKHHTTRDTLDYILYSANSLDTVGVMETLDAPVVDAMGHTPNQDVPSDHLSVKAVFRLK